MKNIPLAIKIICNVLFFLIYNFIAIMLASFLYGFVISQILGWSVPGSADPIHMKIAFITIMAVLILTVIFRKFFYIPLSKWE